MADNPCLILRKVEDLVYEQRPIPEVGDNEVLVAVKKTGICGSDIHYMIHGRIADFVLENPMVLGHESAGIIFKIGSKVKNLKVGDRVAMEPGAACGTCAICKSGRYELCQDIEFAATPPCDGTFCRYYRLPSHLAHVLPDNVTLEDGAMMEPLSVGVHAVHRLGNFRANQSVAIFGCGPIGLLCMAVAKALGASRIIAVDINPSRLQFAKAYVATEVFFPPIPQQGESSINFGRRNATCMKKELGIDDQGPHAIDLVVDASGAEVSIQTAFHIVMTGGTFVQVGMGSNPNVVVNVGLLIQKEIDYKGSFRYGPGDYPLAIALVAKARIDLRPLVTHRYKFRDAIIALKTTQAGKSCDGKTAIKVIVDGPDVEG